MRERPGLCAILAAISLSTGASLAILNTGLLAALGFVLGPVSVIFAIWPYFGRQW